MNLDNIKGMIKEVFGDEANRVRIIISGDSIKPGRDVSPYLVYCYS